MATRSISPGSLSTELKSYRSSRGLSQVELGRSIGVSHSVISAIELSRPVLPGTIALVKDFLRRQLAHSHAPVPAPAPNPTVTKIIPNINYSFPQALSSHINRIGLKRLADLTSIPATILQDMASGSRSCSLFTYNVLAAAFNWPPLIIPDITPSSKPGFIIRTARIKAGLSRAQLAGKLSLSEATIADAEDDLPVNPFDQASIIAALNINIDRPQLPQPTRIPYIPYRSSWLLQGRIYSPNAPIQSENAIMSLNNYMRSKFPPFTLTFNGRDYSDFTAMFNDIFTQARTSIRDFARLVRLSPLAVNNYLGGRSPRMDCYNKIAITFNMPCVILKPDGLLFTPAITMPDDPQGVKFFEAFTVDRTRKRLSVSEVISLSGADPRDINHALASFTMPPAYAVRAIAKVLDWPVR